MNNRPSFWQLPHIYLTTAAVVHFIVTYYAFGYFFNDHSGGTSDAVIVHAGYGLLIEAVFVFIPAVIGIGLFVRSIYKKQTSFWYWIGFTPILLFYTYTYMNALLR